MLYLIQCFMFSFSGCHWNVTLVRALYSLYMSVSAYVTIRAERLIAFAI